jgi:hypothetical protein
MYTSVAGRTITNAGLDFHVADRAIHVTNRATIFMSVAVRAHPVADRTVEVAVITIN